MKKNEKILFLFCIKRDSRLEQCSRNRRPCSICSGDLEAFTLRCANKPSRKRVNGARSTGEKKKLCSPRGDERKERGCPGKREKRGCRRHRRNARAHVRTRLSGQFESIKPKVAAGLCSSTRSLTSTSRFPLASGPRCSRRQTGNFHLAVSS